MSAQIDPDEKLANRVTTHPLWKKNWPHSSPHGLEEMVALCIGQISSIPETEREERTRKVIKILRSRFAKKAAKTRQKNKEQRRQLDLFR